MNNERKSNHVWPWLLVGGLLLIFLILFIILIPTTRTSANVAQVDGTSRRVNIPQRSDTIWEQSAIFWFGVNEPHGANGRNYTDVRLLYTDTKLHIRFTVVDYHLWFDRSANADTDLTKYDAIAVYLDTSNNNGSQPQTDDYMFLHGARQFEDRANYRRQAHGTGSGWDTNWNGTWTNWGTISWGSGPGANDNSDLDFGWTGGFSIPWSSLGLSGPPPEGTVWGLGVQLYDRDDGTNSGILTPEFWPETFDANKPNTWAELHFGTADYQPPTLPTTGQMTIRAASPNDNSVEDAWMGGGGWCNSGHEGNGLTSGSDVNFGGGDPNEPGYGNLFVGTETAETHFPCFNKSYLRFALDTLPPGKEIISATMTLHLWGNAGFTPSDPQPSWVHLFSIKDPWGETTITWNNAPLAYENVNAIWMNPYSQPGNIQWPGDAYTWDATQAVAEAYAAGEAVSMAIYGSDAAQHSSKYLTSSETGDWNANGRPALHVIWGDAPGTLQFSKQASAAEGNQGDSVTYTLSFKGNGESLNLVDDLPSGFSAPTHLDPGLNYASGQITWSGTPADGANVTLTYAVQITTSQSKILRNQATLTASSGGLATAAATIIVNPVKSYLPIALK
ncbi:MAG: DNRLRE domain-containing protein [Chloroflexi bacterium]|nr:DNRLRE domain-containing protein [Chloroflexota bacterium]